MSQQAKHDEQIIALRRQELSVEETADQLDISPYTVAKCIRRHGLQGKFRVKKYKRAVRKPAFSLRIVGNNEVIHVLPTSRLQFYKLLRLLQQEGGEVI